MLDVIDHPLKAGGALESGRIRELRLARPPVNALNSELLRKLMEAIGQGAKESALVVTGQPGIF